MLGTRTSKRYSDWIASNFSVCLMLTIALRWFAPLSLMGLVTGVPSLAVAAGCSAASSLDDKGIVCPGTPVGPVRPGLKDPQVRSAPSRMPLSPKMYTDPGPWDSGPNEFVSELTDCDIPFEKLRSLSSTCAGHSSTAERRCEQYAPSQFPEVVKLSMADENGSKSCTGTLISDQWILTAAHCLIGVAAAADRSGRPQADYYLTSEELQKIEVQAPNAMRLSDLEIRRSVHQAIVYGYYGGKKSGIVWNSDYDNDVALLRINERYSPLDVKPANLAASFTPAATLAGYGLTNAGGGGSGEFNLTWPVPIEYVSSKRPVFNPQSDPSLRSAFCQGDSGGPVFSGRARGCPSRLRQHRQAEGERRPRLVQAVISAFEAGRGGTGDLTTISTNSCLASPQMIVQRIDLSIKLWICDRTSRAVGGCSD